MQQTETFSIPKRVRTFVIAAFATFLALPLVLTVIGLRPAATENRAPSRLPDLGLVALVDAETYRVVDRYLDDRFALRGLAVRTNARLNSELWNQVSGDVRRGRDGWLFYLPSLRRLCTESTSVDRGLEILASFTSQVESRGAVVRIAVAPEKTSVYPEFLTDQLIGDGTCAFAARDRLRDALKESDRYVDMFAAMEKLKASTPDPIYMVRDTHWDDRGASQLAADLVSSIDPSLVRPDDAKRVADKTIVPDLTLLLGLPQEQSSPALVVDRDVTVSELEPVAVEGSFAVQQFKSAGPAGVVPGRTIMIYDSFGSPAIDKLAPYFEDITFVHWEAMDRFDIRGALSGADTVLLEVAEREFTWRMGERLEALVEPGSA